MNMLRFLEPICGDFEDERLAGESVVERKERLLMFEKWAVATGDG
jgi:hypothetical protein